MQIRNHGWTYTPTMTDFLARLAYVHLTDKTHIQFDPIEPHEIFQNLKFSKGIYLCLIERAWTQLIFSFF